MKLRKERRTKRYLKETRFYFKDTIVEKLNYRRCCKRKKIDFCKHMPPPRGAEQSTFLMKIFDREHTSTEKMRFKATYNRTK